MRHFVFEFDQFLGGRWGMHLVTIRSIGQSPTYMTSYFFDEWEFA